MSVGRFRFEPVGPGSAQHHWERPSEFSWARDLDTVPVSDTEYLLCSHHLPLLVREDGARTRVVAALHGSLLRHPLVDGQGRWRRGYVPLALRLLPFGSGPPGAEAGRFWLTRDAFGAEPGRGAPLLGPDGALSPQTAEAERAVAAAAAGAARLGAAAELLRLADLLAPLPGLEGSTGGELFTVDTAKLSALLPNRGAILARDGFAPVQLLFTLLFSRKLLSGRIETALAAPPEPGRPAQADLAEVELGSLDNLNFAVDAGDLIPLDFFANWVEQEVAPNASGAADAKAMAKLSAIGPGEQA